MRTDEIVGDTRGSGSITHGPLENQGQKKKGGGGVGKKEKKKIKARLLACGAAKLPLPACEFALHTCTHRKDDRPQHSKVSEPPLPLWSRVNSPPLPQQRRGR